MSKKVEKVEKVKGTQNQKITQEVKIMSKKVEKVEEIQEVKTSMKNEMSNKLILVRKGNEVFCNDIKLYINEQKTKNDGKGAPVVKIEGLPNSNGQKWISLNKLNEGENIIEAKGANRTSSNNKKYILTPDEQKIVNELQSEIDKLQSEMNSIIEKAKERYVPIPDLKADINSLSQEERIKLVGSLESYLSALRGE
jgi:phage host-nuclease inhibitor protein Gam